MISGRQVSFEDVQNQNPDKTVIMPDDLLSERMRQKNWIILK